MDSLRGDSLRDIGDLDLGGLDELYNVEKQVDSPEESNKVKDSDFFYGRKIRLDFAFSSSSGTLRLAN